LGFVTITFILIAIDSRRAIANEPEAARSKHSSNIIFSCLSLVLSLLSFTITIVGIHAGRKIRVLLTAKSRSFIDSVKHHFETAGKSWSVVQKGSIAPVGHPMEIKTTSFDQQDPQNYTFQSSELPQPHVAPAH
jgi:hypothetical protein